MAAITARATTPSTSNTATYASGSFTPATGDLLFAFASTVASVTNPATLTASANSITFTQTHYFLRGTGDSLYLFVANQLVGASPVSMTVTLDLGGDPATGCSLAVGSISGMTAVGSAAVRQIEEDTQGTTSPPTLTYPSTPLTSNPHAAMLVNNTDPAGVTEPSGWTEVADTGHGSPSRGFEWAFVNSGHTSTSVTWGSNSPTFCVGVTVEFDSSAGGPNTGSATGTFAYAGAAVGHAPWLQLQRESSFENLTSDWSGENFGALTFPTPGDAPHGTHVARLTATTGANPYFHADSGTDVLIPVAAEQIGQYVTAYAEYRWVGPNSPNTTTRLNVYYLDDTFAVIGSNIGAPFTPSTSWARTQNNDNVIPADTAYIELRPIINNAIADDAIEVDQLYVHIGSNIPDAGPHPPWTAHALDVTPPGAGSATGTWTFAGAAAGHKEPSGTATGTVTFTGAAAGTRHAQATATGTFTFTGAAVGHSPEVGTNSGFGTGAFSFAGTATGHRTPQATATGTATFTGSAAGTRHPVATATGSWAFTGAAVGSAPPNSGSATGAWAFVGTGEGTRHPQAVGSGTFTFTGAATGTRQPRGSATGTWTFTGAADARVQLQRESSFEYLQEEWVAGNGGVLTFPTPGDAPHGTFVARLTAPGSGNPYFHPDTGTELVVVPIDPADIGKYVTGYAEMRWASVNTPNTTTRLNVYYLDDTFAYIGSNIGTPRTLTTSWTRLQNNDNVIPVDTAWVELRPQIHGAVAGDAIEVDKLYVTIGSNIHDTGPHPEWTVHALDRVTGSGTGSWSFTGAASGSRSSTGDATGSTSWSGAATGSRDQKGVAAGATTWTGSATGSTERSGTGTGDVAWAGAAVGHAPVVGVNSGFGSGETEWEGTASAVNARSGSGAGTLAWVGGAVGSSDRTGAATGHVAWIGVATGDTPAHGSAAGGTTWVGIATGSSEHHGTATGTTTWVGTGGSLSERSGSATGLITWVGVAVGQVTIGDYEAGAPLPSRYDAGVKYDHRYTATTRPPRYRSPV